MKEFLGEEFLLNSQTARRLYTEYAEKLPIIDYHCHLPPAEIAEDLRFENLSQIWLKGDHYKWRAMRANGEQERFCTGDADDYDKFLAWARTVPYTIGNPLYHWTHMELKRPFGITGKVLNTDTAKQIWDHCNGLLATPEFSTRGILRRFDVRLVCTTDDPIDTLEHHDTIAADPSFAIQVLPALRPDKAMAVEKWDEYPVYLEKLEQAAGVKIQSFSDLKEALARRHAFFHSKGCRLSDHGILRPMYLPASESELDAVFKKARGGNAVEPEEALKFKTAVLLHVGRLDAGRGWTMQLHMSALRNNNSRMYTKIGPDTGFDSMADGEIAAPLVQFLDALDSTDELPKTILYNLNPRDNELLPSIMGSFQGGVPGKMQFGSGWWYNDQIDGMRRQMTALANIGLLRRFVGMLTDSRSFLSYPRHDYFRRLMCDMVGSWAEAGEAPNDIELLGVMVREICYENAKNYFGFQL